MTPKELKEEKKELVPKTVYVDPPKWIDFVIAVGTINSTITEELDEFLTRFNSRFRVNIDLAKQHAKEKKK